MKIYRPGKPEEATKFEDRPDLEKPCKCGAGVKLGSGYPAGAVRDHTEDCPRRPRGG